MFCHVLFTVAAHYKIICDDKIKPLNSIEPFKSPNDRLLYDTLIEYMDGYQRKRGFMKFLRTIHQHINDYEMKRKCKPSVTVIKLLYAINIINKFQLGEPSYDFLDLAPNFDEGLIEHWSKICTYNMQVIERSLCKSFKDYNEQDYYINKSVSYIALSYITLVYEIILYQVAHNRWCWTSGDYFEEHIGEFVENTDNIARFVFLKQNCYRTNVNLDVVNIFSYRLTYDKASSLLQEMKGNPINIHAVYSRSEVLKALKLYLNQKKYSISSVATDPIVWMLKSIQNNSKILATHNTIEDLVYNGDIAIPYIEICPPARYEFFFGTNGEICEKYTFEQWKRNTIALEAELNAVDYLFTLWLQGRLQRSITFDE